MLIAGVLVLVINYTGDRINFGLAVEKALREGLKVSARAHSTGAYLNVYVQYFVRFLCMNGSVNVYSSFDYASQVHTYT
jgi:hypothetical protein